jgi:hypothetical protein
MSDPRVMICCCTSHVGHVAFDAAWLDNLALRPPPGRNFDYVRSFYPDWAVLHDPADHTVRALEGGACPFFEAV